MYICDGQGVPFSPVQRIAMAGEDSDVCGGCKCMLRGVVLCIVFVTMLPDTVDDSRTSTRCLYFR
jgi:hypothetical protein